MGRKFTIEGGVRVKVPGDYPWPYEGQPDRTVFLDRDDVLTEERASYGTRRGSYAKHTGLCCYDIRLLQSEVEPWPEPVRLQFTF